MKKLLVLVIFSAFIFSGCTYYTCPTYAVGPAQTDEQNNLVEETTANP